MKNAALTAIGFAVALGVAPALAQTTTGNTNAQTPPAAATTQPAATPPPGTATTKSERGTATVKPTGIPPSQRNPVLADNGDVRIGKVIGSDIFNKDDKKIGSVDDVLVAEDGKLNVAVSANNKLVLVPWDKVQFGDAKMNSDNKVLMLDETDASLKALPEFHYQNQNKKK